MYSTEPGALVHIKELLDSEGKFRSTGWWLEGFDENLYCEGSFLTWEMDQTLLQEEGKTDGTSKKQLTNVIINSENTLLYCFHEKISAICLAERSTILAVFVVCFQYLYSLTNIYIYITVIV